VYGIGRGNGVGLLTPNGLLLDDRGKCLKKKESCHDYPKTRSSIAERGGTTVIFTRGCYLKRKAPS